MSYKDWFLIQGHVNHIIFIISPFLSKSWRFLGDFLFKKVNFRSNIRTQFLNDNLTLSQIELKKKLLVNILLLFKTYKGFFFRIRKLKTVIPVIKFSILESQLLRFVDSLSVAKWLLTKNLIILFIFSYMSFSVIVYQKILVDCLHYFPYHSTWFFFPFAEVSSLFSHIKYVN